MTAIAGCRLSSALMIYVLMKRMAVLFAIALWSNVSMAQKEYKYASPDEPGLPDWVVLMYSDSVDAGEVVRSYELYYSTHEFVKDQHTQYYKRWLRSISREQSTNGRSAADRRYLALRQREASSLRSAEQWESIGPWDWDHDAIDKSYACGAAHVYTVQQSRSNPDVLYAGTATAGLWRSVDHGVSWQNVTAELPMGGLSALEINSENADVVYAELLGSIYKTTDGGIEWVATGSPSFQSMTLNTADIVMHPADTAVVWACTNGGLFLTENGGQSWTQKLGGDFQELEFHPTDHDTVYAVRHTGERTQFYRSLNGGTTFDQVTDGWPDPDTTAGEHQRRTEIAVSIADPDLVVALATGSANGGSGLYGVYVSDDAGGSWTFQCCGPQPAGVPSESNMNLMGWNPQGLDDGGQYYYDLALDISPTNADSIFVAGVNLWISGDGGSSFVCPSSWSHSYKPNYVHADIHDVRYMEGTNELWIACDGGIFFSDNNADTVQRRMTGIAGTDFWGFGVGKRDPSVMLGGTYHNGTLLKDDTVYLNDWISTDGGDNYRGFVHPVLRRQAFSDYNIKTLSGDRTVKNTTRAFQNKPNASYIIGRSSDVLFHPYYYETWYTGSGTALWKTENNGYTFEQLHDFGVDVAAMDMCQRDPQVIYVTTFPEWWDPKAIWRTMDGGETWTNITPPSVQLSGNLWVPFDIVVSATDPLKVWIVRTSMYGGTNLNGAVLFESADGGETWTNITGDFPSDEAPTCLAHLQGTDDALYVGTRRGVYRKLPGSTTWSLYSAGLPAWTTTVRVIPDYANGVIRTGTNRSVWERDYVEAIAPMAFPSVYRTTHRCLADSIQFYDNSLAGTGASWEWTFPGGSPSTSTDRDPRVVYSEEGFYDVQLIVSDTYGTDTLLYERMIKILDECGIDDRPEKAMLCIANPDHAQVPEVGVTVDSFTIMAWVKPYGTQNDYSGIVMNDGATGGLNFREGNNTLGYHWPGGQWWWDSNLEVQPDVWSHVAMVVTPSQVRLYLDGVEAIHNTATDPVELTTMRIGSYKGWNDRNYSGMIDEVSMFERALTIDEIRSFRHLTLKGDEEGILAYYQFNSNGTDIFDKAGSYDATLNGNAVKVRSRAPLGGGVSEGMEIASDGIYEYTSSGVTIDFGPGSVSPNGPLWITRLKVDPDTLGGVGLKLHHGYYIFNNYGTNQVLGSPFTILFDSTGFVSDSMAYLNQGEIVGRASNTEIAHWSPLADSLDLLAGVHGGATTANIKNFLPGQIIITRDSFPHGMASVTLARGEPELFTGGNSIAFNISSDSAGLVLPVVSSNGLEAIGTPLPGMLIFYAPDRSLYVYDGSAWREVATEFMDLEGATTPPLSDRAQLGTDSTSGGILALGNSGALLVNTLTDEQFTDMDFPAEGAVVYREANSSYVYYDGEEWAEMKFVADSLNATMSVPGTVPGMAIGTNDKAPAAALQMGPGNKVLRIPVTNCESVGSPGEGTLIFDKVRKAICVFNGESWLRVRHN